METTESTPYCIEVYIEGSKIEGNVEARAAVYVDQVLKTRCKYKLQNCSSNNQPEQIAILKSLEELASLSDHNGKTIAI
jgi:hypothetical protein